ncbi:MAG: Hint domain-containing protein [Planctomycetota bacterium]
MGVVRVSILLAMASALGGCIAVGCFPAGTMIATPDGPVPIELIETGDLVLSSPSGVHEISRVTRVQRFRNRETIRLRLENASSLEVTGTHPVFTSSGWRSASTLKPGDRVHGSGGFVSVVGVAPSGTHDVFDIEVAGSSEYFANGIRVHNKTLIATDWAELRGEWEGLSQDGRAYFVVRIPNGPKGSARPGGVTLGSEKTVLTFHGWIPLDRGFEATFKTSDGVQVTLASSQTRPGRRFEGNWTGEVPWAGPVSFWRPDAIAR